MKNILSNGHCSAAFSVDGQLVGVRGGEVVCSDDKSMEDGLAENPFPPALGRASVDKRLNGAGKMWSILFCSREKIHK